MLFCAYGTANFREGNQFYNPDKSVWTFVLCQ